MSFAYDEFDMIDHNSICFNQGVTISVSKHIFAHR